MTVLIVDDEPLVRWSLRELMAQEGHATLEAATAREALQAFSSACVDLVLLDLRLPDGDGLSVMREMRALDPDVPVIMLTAHATVDNAVRAMGQGAFHYARKPVSLDEVAALVASALDSTRLRREVRRLRARDGAGESALVGESPAMLAVKAAIGVVSRSPSSTVLVTGESGTGKDVVAREVHRQSERSAGPFVNITCSALPDTLLESEFFGHERGAFTDARAQKRGLLEQAGGGSVFLDEIGDTTPALQAKLLRFLEEKAFRRIGGARDIRSDVRIIAATNRDLDELVARGVFRADLFYRLAVVCIEVPALRERRADIVPLASHFVQRLNAQFHKHVTGLSADAAARLESHHWPGNVRELRNAIERAMLFSTGVTLTARDFGELARRTSGAPVGFSLPPDGVNLSELERSLVVQALAMADGNQTRAGALLGLNRDQIRYRLQKYGLATQAGEAQERER